jgi:hypothetical protein
MTRTGSSRPILIAVALLVFGSAAANCGGRKLEQEASGTPDCRPDAVGDLLSSEALQCWFSGPGGRWRILSHDSHYDVLVVNVEALALRDADHIARDLVAQEGSAFSEILVYAQPPSTTPSPRVRRVQWTRSAGFDVLEFDGSAAR